MMIAALANAGAALQASREWIEAARQGVRFHRQGAGRRRPALSIPGATASAATPASPTTTRIWRARRSRCGKRRGEKRFLDHAKRWVAHAEREFLGRCGRRLFPAPATTPNRCSSVHGRLRPDQPSANGMMLGVLCALYIATADTAYPDRSNALIQAFAGEVGRAFIFDGRVPQRARIRDDGSADRHRRPPTVTPRRKSCSQPSMGRSLPNRTLMVVDPDQTRCPKAIRPMARRCRTASPRPISAVRNTCSQPITNPVQLSQIAAAAGTAARSGLRRPA